MFGYLSAIRFSEMTLPCLPVKKMRGVYTVFRNACYPASVLTNRELLEYELPYSASRTAILSLIIQDST
jgi:hypothetical protein